MSAEALFRATDADSSGSITPDELLDALLASGVEYELVCDLFEHLDSNSDGVITPDEWLRGEAAGGRGRGRRGGRRWRRWRRRGGGMPKAWFDKQWANLMNNVVVKT